MNTLRVRTAALTLASALLIGGGASAQSDADTGTLVVLNKGGGTATFVDVASGETIATLPTGEGPHELAMTADGRWAVSTDYGGGNSLTVFDVQSPRVVRTIDLSAYPRPHGAHFLPGDTLLAVTSEASRNVVLVAPMRGEIVGAIPTQADGSHMVAVTGDGSTLYTGDIGQGTVSRLDVSRRAKVRSYDVPAQPEAITVSRDGSQVWVGSNAEGFVSIVDTESGAVDSPLTGFEWPYRILILEEHDLVVIPDLRRSEVRFVDYDGRSDIQTLALPDEGPQGVALTHDRQTLFLSLSRSAEVAVIDLATLEIVRRIPVGPTPDGIGWSPLVVRR
ncbi:MAG: YncE family protein [Gemmatimonadota bacterium]|nr:YncE family protein [Gemmatimonadota bacterium]